MPKKLNSRFSIALILSILLHIGFVMVLVYSTLEQYLLDSNENQGESIEAVMIDPKVLTEQYQNEIKHQNAVEQIKQDQKDEIEKKAREFEKQQQEEQAKLKAVEKQRLLVSQQKEKEKEEINKALLEKKKIEEETKKVLAEKKQAEKEKEEAERKKQLLDAENKKIEQEKQRKILLEKAAKQKAEKEKKDAQELNDILNGLTSNAPKVSQGVSSDDLNQFKSQINTAISNKFINTSGLYTGKNCLLRVQLAPDGLLLKVDSIEGDQTLCREAISATKQAHFPKPKNDQLYQKVKDVTVNFKPN